MDQPGDDPGRWAWHYKRYNKMEPLAEAEEEARQEQAGLWADPSPVRPWEFRMPAED